MLIERTNPETCIELDPSSWWEDLFMEAVGKETALLCCQYSLRITLACAGNLLQLHGISEGMDGRLGLPCSL